ncbi:MAG: pectate lyase precursor [Pseudomonadota bacterium]
MKLKLFAASLMLASTAQAVTLDAKTYVGASTPLQTAQYGVRNYSAPVLVSGLHDPANFMAAPRQPTWQFAQVDPTGGVLTFERQSAPATGWHAWTRKGKVLVTGGSSATPDRIYTVFNGQQLIAAINQAGNEPKIIRVVGHIDLRWSENNTVFSEYTSYSDQKYGGSISLPSNTTLVGINDAQGRPARMTGTAILIGGELALTPGGDPEADFKAWIAAGKDGDDYPTWTRNVIVRNIALDTPWDVNPEDAGNAYADGITVSRGQNIYLDHLTISDGDTPDSLAVAPWLTRHDGALDVVRGGDYVTIANSYFYKHHKTTLVGNGDSGRAWSDDGRMHVTFSGNLWDGATTRLPLNRYGQVHMFNNLITGSVSTTNVDIKFESGTDARYHSNMLLENNYYNITGLKLTEFCGKAIKGKDFIGFRSSGHIFTSDKAGTNLIDGQCGYAQPSAANLWNPPYLYALQTATSTLTAVPANAGAGKLK